MKQPNSTLKQLQPVITAFFRTQHTRIFTRAELRRILESHRGEWQLPISITYSRFCDFLIKEMRFRVEECPFKLRTYTRYTMGEVPLHDFLLYLVPDSYFSHFTALELNEMTTQKPDRIYLNYPQERKTAGEASLDQTRIDTAFRGPVRVSKNSAVFRGKQILLLNSMGHKDLGIIEMAGPEKTKIRITDVERTLIDIVARPVYSGGLSNVLAAYRKAREKASISRLVKMLKELNFSYPYHQSIGFCLERSGYKGSEITLLRQFPIKLDFYLDYQMAGTYYSKDWQLYFPKSLK
jgi:hypothetical protein